MMHQQRSNLPKVIYKYVSYADGIKLFFSKQLKFSTPDSFNDPHDCNENIFKFTIDNYSTQLMLDEGLYSRDEDEINLSIEELTKKLLTEGKINLQNLKFREIFEGFKRSLGVTCFSRESNDFLMWSHYADKHKGFCIGFDTHYFNEKCDLKVYKIIYSNSFKKYDFFNETELACNKWLTTKSKKWKYENEYRLFTREKKPTLINEDGLLKFDENLIKHVSIGCKNPCNIDLFIKSLKQLGYKDIEFIKYKLKDDSFDIEAIKLN
ncbi:MAG: DUF2971 domain-containing protein [Bacteroidales bacterium]|nr:DUF2971 domain-containing protein [Bacteroidales bacterium]